MPKQHPNSIADRILLAVNLLCCVGGIYGAYLTQGVMQETLSTKRFGPELKRFTHLPALNGVQSWACFVWAYVLLKIFEKGWVCWRGCGT